MNSRGLDIWVSFICFQKSIIGWPQRPPTEKVLKFIMTFFMILPNIFFSKHQNKAEFKDLDHSEVLSSDFPVLRTSAASMTSTSSITSIASMTSTASFHQIFCWSWWLDHPWHPNDQIDLSGLCNLTGLNSLNSPISSKNFLIQMVWSSPAPKWPILVHFCGMDHQKSNFSTFYVRGCWIHRRIAFKKIPLSMLILGQKSCILGPTIFKIPQPNWH